MDDPETPMIDLAGTNAHINDEAFKKALHLTHGNIRKSMVAAGYSVKQARKGIAKLPNRLKEYAQRFREHSLALPEIQAALSPAPTPCAERLENGQFAPGASGNPDGRSRTFRISQAIQEMLETDGAKKYAAVLDGIADKGKHDSDRIRAIEVMRDSTEGKPVQAHVVGTPMDYSGVAIIAELLKVLTASEQSPPTIDAQD